MNSHIEDIFFRRSHVVLILSLLTLEIALSAIYLIIRIPKSIFIPSLLNISENQSLDILGFAFFVGLTTTELLLVLRIVLAWASEQFEIKGESLIHRRGIFRIKQEAFTLRNLGSVNMYQSLLGKILNYGTIVINSPILKTDIVLPDIHNPQQIIAALEDNVDESHVKSANIIQRKS